MSTYHNHTLREHQSGSVIWITGLSGSGKTTLATEVAQRLRSSGQTVIALDGDVLREVFGASAEHRDNHGREARLALAFQYAHLCRVISTQGHIVVISTISLFKEIHQWNRQNLPNYFEVYLKVSLDELKQRDPKGIYRRFDTGELRNVAGLDLPIDEPEFAHLSLEFDLPQSPEATAKQLISHYEHYLTRREN